MHFYVAFVAVLQLCAPCYGPDLPAITIAVQHGLNCYVRKVIYHMLRAYCLASTLRYVLTGLLFVSERQRVCIHAALSQSYE
jgi:hypothetical protein